MRNNTYQIRHNQSINKNNTKTTLKEAKKINFRTIYDLYKSNFINNCELILLEKQNTFLDNFFNKMKLIIKSEYEEDIFEKNKIIYEITKKCENYFISDIYWPMYDTCSNGLQKFKSFQNKNNDFYLTNFLSHCSYEQIALHYCGSKFIKISSKINANIYAICSGCKKCYFNTCVPIYCPFSQKKYYTKITKESEDNLEPATWLEYHCKNPIVNEQMSCIRCGDKFWIRKNKLYCKTCKFEVDPLLILWTCTICKKEFRSRIKKYNPLEYKDIENAIQEAFFNKQIAKPEDFPCKCFKNKDIRNYDFCHKANGLCKGVLYYGTLKNEEILVCSLCNCIFSLNKFYWNCPICGRKFISNNIMTQTKSNLEPITRIKSQRFKKNDISNSVNIQNDEDKILLYLSSKGTPLRDINKYDINYSNILNSYVKKKPDDYYFNNSIRKREDQHNKSYLESKNKRRNLSINLTNKINANNSDNEANFLNDTNSINEKDNKYNTNNNFFFKNNLLRDSKKDIKDRNSKYLTKNSVNDQTSEFFSPLKNEKENDKNYLKIQLTTKASKRYNGISDSRRYASTSTRNYNHNQDNGNTFVNYKNERYNPNTSIKKRKYERYFPNDNISIKNDNTKKSEPKNIQIYIPKKKIDLNKSNIIISSPINQPNRRNKLNSNNSKANLAKSVGIRERYKRINIKNNNINYDKRNLKTMQEDDYKEEERKVNIFSGQMPHISNAKGNNENYYKEIKSSSQCKIDKEKYKNANLKMGNFKNNLKYDKNDSSSMNKKPKNENYSKNNHKYNKRYIGNIYNPNQAYITINTTSSNIYNRTSINFNNKDKTGTNKSNGGDNISENNVTINDENNSDKMNNNIKKANEKNFHSVRREKRYIIDKSDVKDEKDFDDRKSFKGAKINNNNIINSFKNGGKPLKENENQKKYKNINVDEKHDENNELKEFNFNDYKIITQLGQGTFGKIYLVQDKNNELFSMKKIILSEELDVKSVINEYRMCQKLRHSNVVKILGIYNNKLDLTTYVVYVLMEVGLTDWEKEIRSYNDKSLEYTEQELIQIIKQLSSVLSFLQRNNISHRDIKPQNILVFKNGIYKVADFGEAKQIDNIAKNLINFSLRGTELYMSPLLFNGLRTGQIDIKHNLFKSDVYSLGLCVLYAAVRNNKPLYEIRKYVDMTEVKKFLNKLLKGKYSQKFLSLLISMLEIHEKNRPDFIELEKTMNNWI